jgi:hypothetical protein
LYLQRFIREVYAPAYARLGWEAAKQTEEDHSTGLLRAAVLGTLAFAGDSAVIEEVCVCDAFLLPLVFAVLWFGWI